ncbi:hypothetical protein Tsubulata_010852 [Turnera subulata]|uniref:RING-type domain-containing protein n=1 Tax=Turnera subulata TaxID=218843 RepID=A0A9Q0FS22_9ROSI|nr:hypothetical protein Tsubulata_010852 [Turnera subulata]
MAIAGLHNVSVLDSSFLRESQSETVRRRVDDGRTGTRASSLVHIRQEVEDEHVVSQSQGRVSQRLLQRRTDGSGAHLLSLDATDGHSNDLSGSSETGSLGESEYGQWSPGPMGSENGQEDSSGLGEVERERVRQIFREWMNSSARERTSNISRRNHGTRAEWLGENEQERVRLIREWVQMNSRQRSTCVNHTEEQGAEVAGRIEQVLDGMVVNHNEGRTELSRRGIRRLCGRQALLDMLKKAERERQTELQGLLEHRAVSQFAHRNRIQSLLRGRFLRNDRMIEDERPMSTAASELGLLRQRHTVSDLREGFFSRLDHSVCGQASSNASDTISNTDINGTRSEHAEESSSEQIIDEFHGQSESNIVESNSHGLLVTGTDIEGDITEDTSWPGSTAHLEDEPSEVSETRVCDTQQPVNTEFVGRGDGIGEGMHMNLLEGSDHGSSRVTLENEAGVHVPLVSGIELLPQQSEPNREATSVLLLPNHSDDSEDSAIVDPYQHGSGAEGQHWQDQVLDVEESGSSGASLESNEWRDGVQNSTDGLQQETIGNEWLENEDREEASEVWHEDAGFQEAVQNWWGEPSDQETVAGGRMDPFYLPDDDNVYSMEIRELLSRRSVSTLLRSGFRESLDQLIRSYVERQSHDPVDWELQGTSPSPASVEQDLEQQSGDQNEGQGDAVQSPLALPSSPMPPAQQLWDQESNHYSWTQHDMHQRFGIVRTIIFTLVQEWDIINDLRIDMARLQQRMNNMQRMLEACMDMQLELQRSIRQEVSAALNRSAGSAGAWDNCLPEDRSKWDHVRKGMCCICCDSSIDTLLYRCGHMCTCSKCANELVQSGEKCPMCRAPVVEVIRAYSIL